MNQLCKVCGEPAAGFHFGAFTCEGCKSFFGRSYNNLSSISECKNNSECVINKKNRTACKACRLKKCLLVGMSKNGSRYGRRSNWFKIHCLLQEQQQQRDQQQQQHHQSKNPSDLMFLGLMDEYRNNRASLSSSSPSISSPDSHNSDSSVEIGEKRKINNIDAIKASAKMQNNPVPNMTNLPLSSHLASIFQLLPSPLGPLPLHLLPPPPLASPLYRPFHDYHHLYAQQHNFLSPTSLTPLANLPNNNLPDIVNNNLLNKSKTNDFYKKYYFNQIKKLNDTEDESESEPSLKSPSSAVNVTDLPSPIHSVSPHSPNYPIDLSMKADDLNNNKN